MARTSRFSGWLAITLLAAALVPGSGCSLFRSGRNTVVFLSDFGTKDGAVCAMKGVAAGVDPSLPLVDLTHEIPAYDIWEAAYRLEQAAPYWPAGTVFVAVVDPGVGTARRSVVMLSNGGQFFVSPDNGTLTLVAEQQGLAELREIDETANRRPGSQGSYTFHGRDVYAYTAARLASGAIRFEQVGRKLDGGVVAIPHQPAELAGRELRGTIPALDLQYGNVWTNIGKELLDALGPRTGALVAVTIRHGQVPVLTGSVPYVNTFGDVPEKQPLLYVNSLGNVALAINKGSFAAAYGVQAGPDWSITLGAIAQEAKTAE